MSDATIRQAVRTFPIRALAVDVVEGPDAGRTVTADSETITVGTAEGSPLRLSDPTVSRYHVQFTLRADGVLAVDHRSTNGTWVEGARIERAVLSAGSLVRVGRTTLRVREGSDVVLELLERDRLAGLRGRSASMRRLMAQVQRAAGTDASVLVVGESGTGKELVARALHELGPRASAPFVTVDCGALTPTLIASELFGHERGAFTGADRQHVGAFERAHTGTIFLDELGELPTELQASLLGVIERRRFRRLGGSKDIAIDVRVVSATNRDLRAEVNAGTFRLDLYYRLAVAVLQLPPLRDRAEDVPLLVEHFLREYGHDGPTEALVPKERMRELAAHSWPGNVRELRNVIDALVALGESPPLHAQQATVQAGDVIGGLLELPYKSARGALLNGFEARYLRALLDRCGGNVSRAAREGQIDRSHLTELLQRHGIR